MSDPSIEFVRNLIRENLDKKRINIDLAQVLFFMLKETENLKNLYFGSIKNKEEEDWDIENIGNEEEPILKFSWKDEKSKKELIEFIGSVGGLSKEEVEQITKEGTESHEIKA